MTLASLRRLAQCQEALRAIDVETETNCKPHSQQSAGSDAWVITPFGRAKAMVKQALDVALSTDPTARQG